MGMAATDAQFHILAVDDNLIDRKVIEALLKSSSFKVTTVDSGSKALKFLGWFEEDESSNRNEASVIPPKIHREEVEVNLVITDYCMPGMTGYDLLKKMKESSSLKNIPVVIMSSENVPSRITRCLEGGAEEFLLKPVKASDVNKLRPHMMKTKFKYNNNNYYNIEENSEKSEKKQENKKSTDEEIHLQQNNKKRKSTEEADRSSRSRPRYNNGLTVMSN